MLSALNDSPKDGSLVVVVVAVIAVVFVGVWVLVVDDGLMFVLTAVLGDVLLVFSRFSGKDLCLVSVDNDGGSTTVVTRKRDFGLGKKLVGEQLFDDGGVIGEVVALLVARRPPAKDDVDETEAPADELVSCTRDT